MTFHEPIVINLDDKPYRGILFEGLLRLYESGAEAVHMTSGPTAPALWRTVGAPDRKELIDGWREHIQLTTTLCYGMIQLLDPECSTLFWLFGRDELIETAKQAKASIKEWVGEAPLDRWDELSGIIEIADRMLKEYSEPASEDGDETWTPPDDEPEATTLEVEPTAKEAAAKAQPEPEQHLSVEYQAAVFGSLESYMLGLNLGENMEADLGIDEKLNADALDSYGGRFSLYARVLRALERQQYPEDVQALALLGELVDDVAKDVQTAIDDTDKLLCSARREFVSILYSGIREKLGLPKDEAREGRA